MATATSPSRRYLDEAARDLVRARSKALFGNRDRLDVAIAVARSHDSAVNATDLAKETGLINTRVRAQLLAFAEADLLSEIQPAGGELKRWYRRNDNPFWQACLDLHDAWTR